MDRRIEIRSRLNSAFREKSDDLVSSTFPKIGRNQYRKIFECMNDILWPATEPKAGRTLDFSPETLSLLDHWLGDARAEAKQRPEVTDVVQSAAGAYLGEVIRRQFGAEWFSEGESSGWRLFMTTVYCAFNPIGMAREALLLEPAEGWHAHLELDPGERDAVEARLEALPATPEEEYYLPTTRFDVLWIVVDALRAGLRSRGLGDVRFGPEDYR